MEFQNSIGTPCSSTAFLPNSLRGIELCCPWRRPPCRFFSFLREVSSPSAQTGPREKEPARRPALRQKAPGAYPSWGRRAQSLQSLSERLLKGARQPGIGGLDEKLLLFRLEDNGHRSAAISCRMRCLGSTNSMYPGTGVNITAKGEIRECGNRLFCTRRKAPARRPPLAFSEMLLADPHWQNHHRESVKLQPVLHFKRGLVVQEAIEEMFAFKDQLAGEEH